MWSVVAQTCTSVPGLSKLVVLVEVHLVQTQGGGGRLEEFPADGREGEFGVGQLPLPVGLGFDGRAEGAAQDLVPEADACEADVGAVCPDICG